jgi:hypothetical protein
MRWRIGVARVDVLGVRTCAVAGDAQQSAIRAPAIRKEHEPCRSRIVQSVLLAGPADKAAFHPQNAPAGRRRVTPGHIGSGSAQLVVLRPRRMCYERWRFVEGFVEFRVGEVSDVQVAAIAPK